MMPRAFVPYKSKNWEEFYNFNSPHEAFEGKTTYEKFRCTLKSM